MKFKNKEIKLSREEYRKAMSKVLANPFGDDEDKISAEDKAQMQVSLLLNGMLLFRELEIELFGKEEK